MSSRILSIGKTPQLLTCRNEIIALAGYVVVSPRTPADAPALFATQHFDVVVIGNSMSGEERSLVVEEIRKIDSPIPIVCVSSDGEMPDWADQMIKETDPAEVLLKAIRTCLGDIEKAA